MKRRRLARILLTAVDLEPWHSCIAHLVYPAADAPVPGIERRLLTCCVQDRYASCDTPAHSDFTAADQGPWEHKVRASMGMDAEARSRDQPLQQQAAPECSKGRYSANNRTNPCPASIHTEQYLLGLWYALKCTHNTATLLHASPHIFPVTPSVVACCPDLNSFSCSNAYPHRFESAGPSNQNGLQLKSFRIDKGLEAHIQLPKTYQAFPGIMNGGAVGGLFDCHGNWTAAIALMDHSSLPKPPLTLTTEVLVRPAVP